MSHYIERFCAEHGYWDEDVDVPEEACPKCIKEGKFKTRAMLEARIAELESSLRPEAGLITLPRAQLAVLADRGRAAWPFLTPAERDTFDAVQALLSAPQKESPK